MFILSIDHTITLRYILILYLIASLTFIHWSNFSIAIINFNKDLSKIFWSLLMFVVFIFFHSIFISLEPEWSLSESKSHILYPAILMVTGYFLGKYFARSNFLSINTLINVLFYSLFIHIIYLDLTAIAILFYDGSLITRFGGFMDSPVLANYITNTLVALILAEIIYRMRMKKSILVMPNGILILCLAACIFSSIIEFIRLGDIILLCTCLLAVFLLMYKNPVYTKNKKILVSLLLALSFAIPSIHSFNNDARWADLLKVAPVALDGSNTLWLTPNSPTPKNSEGEEIDLMPNYSNYMRIAWISQSIQYIREDPFGVGYGRNAFGHAIELRHSDYEKNRGMHSHSSVLELMLGVGVLGAILWFVFIFQIIKSSVKLINNNSSSSYFAVLNLLLICTFVLRSFVDANMRDHMFLQFMIILGVSLSCMINERKEQN